MEIKKWGVVGGERDYETRQTCRLCGSNQLTTLLSLGNLHLSTFVEQPKDSEKVRGAPLELVWCENCSLVQLKNTAPPEYMYTQYYWYRSALNQVIVNDLKEIVESARGMVALQAGDVLLDIGANDGTLLNFYPSKYIRVGCEPATNLLDELKQKCDLVIPDFWSYEKYKEIVGDKKAKIITAIGTFYDIENPNQYICDVRKVLDNEGIFIAQLMTSKQMLENNDIGNICHEHLEYYSYASLRYLFEKNGLEIFKVEENKINGGSYRIFARHYFNGSIDYPENITKERYFELREKMEKNKEECVNFIRKLNKEGKRVYGFGASTKGNTILQYYGLNENDLKGIAEIHKGKFGKYTVGTNIPILDENEAKKHADYFLVLPYAFRENFIENNKEWIANGGKFIFAFPNLEVYPKEDANAKKALIIGIAGQDGSYLAELLIEKGYEIHGIVRNSLTEKLDNLSQVKEKVILHKGDLTEPISMYKIISEIRPDEVYNEADLTHAGESFSHPNLSYEVTGLAVGNLLEIIRQINPKIKFFQPLSSHVFGKCEESPQTEKTLFRPQSPHACAKVFAYLLCQYYRDVYGMFISTAFFYNHCSERTSERYAIKKIVNSAIRIKKGLQKKLYLGDLSEKIDLGYAPDYVEASWNIMQLSNPDDFIICTGESHSVKEFLERVFEQIGLNIKDYVEYDENLMRAGKPNNLIGDYSKAKNAFGFEPKTKFGEIIEKLIGHGLKEISFENRN